MRLFSDRSNIYRRVLRSQSLMIMSPSESLDSENLISHIKFMLLPSDKELLPVRLLRSLNIFICIFVNKG